MAFILLFEGMCTPAGVARSSHANRSCASPQAHWRQRRCRSLKSSSSSVSRWGGAKPCQYCGWRRLVWYRGSFSIVLESGSEHAHSISFVPLSRPMQRLLGCLPPSIFWPVLSRTPKYWKISRFVIFLSSKRPCASQNSTVPLILARRGVSNFVFPISELNKGE